MQLPLGINVATVSCSEVSTMSVIKPIEVILRIMVCKLSSATSHSDMQRIESLWTIHHVMRPTLCSLHNSITSILSTELVYWMSV